MTPALIIDCSVVMAWCFIDEQDPQASKVQDRLADEAALVPAHWFLEVTNVLAMAEKKKRISAADATRFVKLLTLLDIQIDEESPARAFERLLPLCRDHGLTSYDAMYLDLAQRRNLPLATRDHDLRDAAKQLGITLVIK